MILITQTINVIIGITIPCFILIAVALTIIDLHRNPHKCPYNNETDKEKDQTDT